MRTHTHLLMPVALQLILAASTGSLAHARKCGSIYRGFAQCLLTLGDSMAQSVQRDGETQEIESICRSWDEFHTCANVALAGCPEEAAAVWESLRQESKKMQFSGNLYDMCANRIRLPISTETPPSQRETNQESLRGHVSHLCPAHSLLLTAYLLLWLVAYRI